MFRGLLRKLGLGPAEAYLADEAIKGVANKATGGAAGKVEAAVEAVSGEVKKRKAKKK